MSRRRRALLGPALVIGLAALVLPAGCGGDSESPQVASVANGATTAPAAGTDRDSQIRRYRDCLVTNGVTLLDQPTEEGMPQIDKVRTNLGVVDAASQKCRSLLQAVFDAERPDQDAIENQRKLAECIRGRGVPDYPDPDPVTGESRVSDQFAARIKDDPNVASAVLACQQQVNPSSTGGTVGG
ncbi:hypothetical protein Ga0074812_105155 [Parafrankia irregularis]|uniref:Secreted protein n=1 Tax=Parafrankia irregularis TaxID=795642 RepID=A0A0S4QIX0_9ACTN|nr:hypothetical protein [Parafrankia irregularis]MBE3205597.1 hypothetical protein [Parafrankia sp. CH37]CUU55504.1 hypothetical protein Ga0074812_105155 [Parafrankia irregularis]